VNSDKLKHSYSFLFEKEGWRRDDEETTTIKVLNNLDPLEVELIKRNNKLDQELYEFGKKIFFHRDN
jgi:hypothetical protein